MRVVCSLVCFFFVFPFFSVVGVACGLLCVVFSCAVACDSFCRVLLTECSSLWLFVCLLSMVSRLMSVVACWSLFVARCLLFAVCGYSVRVVVCC